MISPAIGKWTCVDGSGNPVCIACVVSEHPNVVFRTDGGWPVDLAELVRDVVAGPIGDVSGPDRRVTGWVSAVDVDGEEFDRIVCIVRYAPGVSRG